MTTFANFFNLTLLIMRLLTISILIFLSSAIFAQNFDWTPQSSGVTVTLNDVFFTDNQTGWAVGDAGIIVSTTDGGQNWTSQTSGTSEKLRAVFFIDENTGWAVGASINKTMIKTTDGGSTWLSIAENNIPNSIMFDIAFADVNRGWTLSYDSIYMTSDGGSTWVNEAYFASTQQNPRALAVTSDTTAFVGGSKFASVTTREAVVFYRNTVDMPLAWSVSPFNNSTTGDEFISIDFTASKIGFAGGKKGKLYKKSGTDDHDPWDLTLDLSSQGVSVISSISFANDNNGMFSFSKSISGTNYAFIYHTSNTGDIWSATPDSIPDFLSPVLHAPDSTNAWLVGSFGNIYKGVRKPSAINTMSLNMDVSIYPNPATDIINVELVAKSNELVNYTLLDVTGRIIEQGQWSLNSSNSRFTLSLSDAIKGMYLLKLSTDKGQSTFQVLKK